MPQGLPEGGAGQQLVELAEDHSLAKYLETLTPMIQLSLSVKMWPLGRFIYNRFLNTLTIDVKLAASIQGISTSAVAVNRLLKHITVEV